MRNAAELFYIQNIQGSDVLNLDTGATIHFSRVGRKKSIHGSNAGPTKLQAVQVLPEMVRKGKLMRKEPAKKGTKGVEFWILTATVSVDGESHEFWLYIRATKNHQLFYEHTVKVINKNGLGVNGATLAARRWRPRKPDQQIYNNHAMNELHPNRYINENNNRILQIQQDINQVTRTQCSLFGVRCVLGDPTGQGGIDPETKRMLTEAALALGKEKLQGWAADQQRQIDSQRDNPDTISDLGLSADDEKAATAIVGTLAGAAFTGACIAGTWGIGTPACLALGGVVSGVASALMGKLFGAFRRGAPTQAMTWAGWITSGRWNAPGNNAKFRVDYIAQQIGLVTLQEVFEIVLWQPMFYRPSGTVFPWIAERHTAFRWTSTPLDEALPSGAPKPYAFEHIDQDNRIKEDYAYALMNWKADQADEWQNFVAQCRRLAGQLFAPDPDPVDARQCLFQARPVVYDRSLRKAGFGTPFAPGPAKRFNRFVRVERLHQHSTPKPHGLHVAGHAVDGTVHG